MYLFGICTYSQRCNFFVKITLVQKRHVILKALTFVLTRSIFDPSVICVKSYFCVSFGDVSIDNPPGVRGRHVDSGARKFN